MEGTSHLGSCSTDTLASSKSGSGALRGHVVRVVSLTRQRHICDMHQRLIRPFSSVLGLTRKAQYYRMLPCLMMLRVLMYRPLQRNWRQSPQNPSEELGSTKAWPRFDFFFFQDTATVALMLANSHPTGSTTPLYWTFYQDI